METALTESGAVRRLCRVMQPLPSVFRPLVATVLVTAAFAAAPRAQGPTLGYSDRFDAPGINRRVFAVGTYGGELYAGGPFDFLTGGGQPAHIARYDGRDWQDVGGGLDGEVRALVEFRGELIAAGEFGLAGTNTRVASIARWNGTRWAPLGQGLLFGPTPARVFALCVHQGDLYAGGSIDTAGGRPALGIARWDGTSWHPVGGGVRGGPEPKVVSFASDGIDLYAGGEFDHAGGVAASNVAAWNGTSWRALGAGLGISGVNALALYRGSLYAGGSFGVSAGVPLRRIARWDAAGGAWRPLGLGIPDYGRASQVGALQVYGGELWVAGIFAYVDSASHGSGILSHGLARWDGTRWHGGDGLYRATFGGDAAGIAMTEWNHRLVIGGEFDHAGPVNDHRANVASHDAVLWNGTGFEVLGDGLGLGDGTSGLLRWRGSLWSIENHHHAGAAVSPAIARFDGARWHTVGPFDPRTDIADAIVFQGDLHVSGDLWFADGRRMSGVIRYDGTAWTPIGGPAGGVLAVHGGELYGGGLGAVQRLGSSGWVRLPPFFGQVAVMRSFGGALYIGGSNLRVGSGGGAVNLLAWDGTSLAPVGGGLDDGVVALHEHRGELWIGGRFTSAGSVTSPRLVRWDGTRYLAFPGPTIRGSFVAALETLGNELFVSGHLGVVGGTDTSLAAWDGATLRPLGTGPNAPANTLLADPATGELWIGGGFFLCDGITAAGLTIWHTTPRWEDLGGVLARGNGVRPQLDGFGALRSGERTAFRAFGFDPGQPTAIVLGDSRVDLPLFGGVMVPAPIVAIALPTDPVGAVRLDLVVPAGLPPGFALFAQVWGVDVPRSEFSATNAIVGR